MMPRCSGHLCSLDNPHTRYKHDTDAEGQWDPAHPLYCRVRSLFADIRRGAVVLDLGCNSGGLGRCLRALDPTCVVIGVDLSQELLDKARAKGYLGTLRGRAESLPYAWMESFDYVVMAELLEHAENPVACVQEARRVLKPDGVLLGDVPTWFGRWGYRTIRGHPYHRRVFTRRAIRDLLRQEFSMVSIHAEPRMFTSRRFWLPQWYCFEARA